MSEFRFNLLKSILSQPSAPYREGHVIALIKEALLDAKVPHFSDPHGNLILGVASKKEYLNLLSKKSEEPVRVFVAHMDHPGFHGVSWESDYVLEIVWHGGAPTKFLENAPVWLADAKGMVTKGWLKEAVLNERGTTILKGKVEFAEPIRVRATKAKALFGGFAFRQPVWQEGDLLYTKAADDLVGAFSVVSTALDLWTTPAGKKLRKTNSFLGVLTRAEEVGFIGALAHLELGWLTKATRPVVVVSLETSRTLPGAEFGKGPVVRLGDRTTVFDAGSLAVFLSVAQKVLPDLHQKRVMDGGSCEATAATCYQLTAIGISVPLGNYHNQSFEGGPDSLGPMGPGPEFVNIQDVQGMCKLCAGLLQPKLPWADPFRTKRLDLRKHLKKSASLLKTGP